MRSISFTSTPPLSVTFSSATADRSSVSKSASSLCRASRAASFTRPKASWARRRTTSSRCTCPAAASRIRSSRLRTIFVSSTAYPSAQPAIAAAWSGSMHWRYFRQNASACPFNFSKDAYLLSQSFDNNRLPAKSCTPPGISFDLIIKKRCTAGRRSPRYSVLRSRFNCMAG